METGCKNIQKPTARDLTVPLVQYHTGVAEFTGLKQLKMFFPLELLYNFDCLNCNLLLTLCFLFVNYLT